MSVALESLRNIGIMAHINAGKTTLTERILFYTGMCRRMGEVDDGTAVMDWMEQEQERGITITAASTTCRWRDCTINLIDTPGHVDFTGEVERSLRVLDGAVALFSAVEGVQSQSETVWRQATKHGVPRLAFVNKMDRVGADFEMCVQDIRDRFGVCALPFQLPLFDGEDFVGVIDLVRGVGLVFDEPSLGAVILEVPIPEDRQEEARRATEAIYDKLLDDEPAGEGLVAQYLEDGFLPPDTVFSLAREAVVTGGLVPVFCGAVRKNKGVQPLLDAVVSLLPSPLEVPAMMGTELSEEGRSLEVAPRVDAETAALVFKTAHFSGGFLTFLRVYAGRIRASDRLVNARTQETCRIGRLLRMHANETEHIDEVTAGDIAAVVGLKSATTGDTLCGPKRLLLLERIEFPTPVLFQALEPETDADAAKMSASIRELLEEDPSLELRRDSQTGQTLLLGMGELQLEVALDRLKREYGVHCRASTPRVAYRETCSRAAQGQGEVDRSVGGRGQFARISLSLEPAERGSGVHFEVSSPSSLPRDFVRAVEDGVGEGLNSGGRAGYPIVDLRVKLLGGEHHSVDSSEFAFRVAAGKALLSAFANSGPIVLEPIMKVEIVTPNEYMGSVVGEINARRGTVIQITARAGQQVVLAEAPLATLFGIATDLRSSSQGRATCTLQFSHYGNLPASLADQLVTQGTNQENRHGQGKV